MRIASIVAVLLGVTAYAQEPPPPPSPDAQVAPAPAPAPVSRIPGTVFVESDETVDSSNSKDKAKRSDFGVALRAGLVKKNVPVKVLTDPAKAAFTIRSTSSQRRKRSQSTTRTTTLRRTDPE
jgi:hypothetical protein